MAKRLITIRCEIAVSRAKKAVEAARRVKVSANAALTEAEDDLRAAEIDLAINLDLDGRGPGYDHGASRA